MIGYANCFAQIFIYDRVPFHRPVIKVHTFLRYLLSSMNQKHSTNGKNSIDALIH